MQISKLAQKTDEALPHASVFSALFGGLPMP
jgi:hypothetical protein